MILGILLLLTGLTISAVAIYYSVVGLAAIFAAATVPIYIMGASLEVAKLVGASWLKANWTRAPKFIKYYMSIAVVVLMIITSMGIFGFLSKAHLDQSLVSGDVQSKIAVYDDKIKTAQENIDYNRRALKQMDEAVDQVMGRSTSESGADKAVAVRRSQQKERLRLQSEIAASQKAIVSLKESRAPIAAEIRKVEAEVGPIKYIAAFVYGANPDANVLEKAVTWVIILIVVVFDPLAIAMLLAAQMSFQWIRDDKKKAEDDSLKVNRDSIAVEPPVIPPIVAASSLMPEETTVDEKYNEAEIIVLDDPVVEKNTDNEPFDFSLHPYLFTPPGNPHPPGIEPVGPLVHRPEVVEPEVLKSLPVIVDPYEVLHQSADENAGIIAITPPEPAKLTVDTPEVTDDAEADLKKKIYNQAARETDSTAQGLNYVQNGEQKETSLWNQVRSKVSAEFKPKDFLAVIYAKGQFEDFQYDPGIDQELDKFIRDIKNNTHTFGEYTQEQLTQFARRIHELRKN